MPNLTIREIQLTIGEAVKDYSKLPETNLPEFFEYLMVSGDIVRALIKADEYKQLSK